MDALQPIRQRHIALMQKTLDILTAMLRDVDQSTATTLRDLSDGDAGWTTLEVLCHLRDFDGYFRGRAVMMAMQEHPDLPAYDHEAIAVEGRYNEQNLQLVLDELMASRRETVDFFEEAERRAVGTHGHAPGARRLYDDGCGDAGGAARCGAYRADGADFGAGERRRFLTRRARRRRGEPRRNIEGVGDQLT